LTARSRWRAVDGLLLLDKPSGITSNAALQRARRLLQAEKAGHTGTLDPLASGLLPLCLGQAAKFARFLPPPRVMPTANRWSAARRPSTRRR
jgi:tRNA pseudouridine55 synthase